jgi:hypothetical protein
VLVADAAAVHILDWVFWGLEVGSSNSSSSTGSAHSKGKLNKLICWWQEQQQFY